MTSALSDHPSPEACLVDGDGVLEEFGTSGGLQDFVDSMQTCSLALKCSLAQRIFLSIY